MEWSCLIIYRKLVCSIWWLWSFVQSISGERQLVKLFRSEWKKLAFSTLVPVRVLSRPVLWEISMTEVMLVTYVGENVCWGRIFWMLVEPYVGEEKKLNVCNIQYVCENFSVCWCWFIYIHTLHQHHCAPGTACWCKFFVKVFLWKFIVAINKMSKSLDLS